MEGSKRIEGLLALIFLNGLEDKSQQSKIKNLSRAGFSNLEIADLLETTTGVVAQTLYMSRSKKQKAKSKKKN